MMLIAKAFQWQALTKSFRRNLKLPYVNANWENLLSLAKIKAYIIFFKKAER